MANLPKPLTRIFQQEWVPIYKEWYAGLQLTDKLILNMRARGYSNEEVAAKLGYSVQTVYNRVVIIRKAFNATFYN